jgi:SAM-dependent methyltransferase
LPWSYASKVLALKQHAQSMLDMCTGGGEFLSRLQPLPVFTRATEGYAPNVPIARARLEPLGVQVHAYTAEQDAFPYADNCFDLVINRHGYYREDEVLRVLKSGHFFITQQVGGQQNSDLNQWMEAPEFPYIRWTLARAVKQLEQAGWQIVEQQEAVVAQRFYDVGAIVYMLKATPWQIEDFSIEKYFDRLLALHYRIQKEGFVDFKQDRFLIVAQKI